MEFDLKQLLLDMSGLPEKEFRLARRTLADALDPEECADSDFNTHRGMSIDYQNIDHRILEFEKYLSDNRLYKKPEWLLFADLLEYCPEGNAVRFFWELGDIADNLIPAEDLICADIGPELAEAARVLKDLFLKNAEGETE